MKFDGTLTSAGFVIKEADRCVYYRYGGGGGTARKTHIRPRPLVPVTVSAGTNVQI